MAKNGTEVKFANLLRDSFSSIRKANDTNVRGNKRSNALIISNWYYIETGLFTEIDIIQNEGIGSLFKMLDSLSIDRIAGKTSGKVSIDELNWVSRAWTCTSETGMMLWGMAEVQ